MSTLFTGAADGDIADATAYQANWDLLEGSLFDLGPYVISGLAVTIGAGLAVNVALGVASIGGRVTKAAGFTIGSLADATTNYLYLQQNGTGTSNTTGTPPSNSVLLGTCVTAAGAVSSVDTNRSSGRQLKVRTESLVPGGPGAGNPASINLGAWAAAAANSVTVYGTLPSGALPAIAFSSLSDVTLSGTAQGDTLYRGASKWNNLAAGVSGQFLKTQGAAANPVWATLALANLTGDVTLSGVAQGDVLYRGASAWNNLGAGTSGQVFISGGAAANPSWVSALTLTTLTATGDVTCSEAPPGSANKGLLSLGNQGFAGGGGTAFVGSASGTGLAMDFASGYGGDFLNCQLAGTSKAQLTKDGRLIITDMLQCGAFAPGYATRAADGTLGATERTVGADATAGTRTLTLPSAVGRSGREYVVKKIDATANNVVVQTTSSQTIDGALTLTWNTQYQSYTFVSDGANYLLI